MKKLSLFFLGMASAIGALAQPILVPEPGKAYNIVNAAGDYMSWDGAALKALAEGEGGCQTIYFEPVNGEEGYYNIAFEDVDGYLAGDKSNGWTAVVTASPESDLAKYTFKQSAYDSNYINIICKGMKRGGGMLGQDADSPNIYTDKSDGALSIWTIEAIDDEKPEIQTFVLDKTSVQLGIYETSQLNAVFTPAESARRVTWTSSNPDIATVSSSGLVRGKLIGSTTVTATCKDKTASCEVTVTGEDKYPEQELPEGDVRKYAYEGYKLVFAEEFSVEGDPDYDIWNLEDGYRKRNNEDQYYVNPNSENGQKWGVRNAYIQDGVLVIEARNDSLLNPKWNKFSSEPKYFPYSSASLQTKGSWNGGYSWMFGIYEIRAKIKAETGLWPAIWSTGEQYEWPQGGEIDIMEYYGNKIHANVCWGNGVRWGGSWNSKTISMSTLGADWDQNYHIWKMVWDYDRMQLWVDDILINDIDLNTTVNVNPQTDWYNVDGLNPFRDVRQMGWLNLALGGNNGGSLANTTFPSYYVIDYFRVYQKIGTDGAATYHVDSDVSEPTWQWPSGIESVAADDTSASSEIEIYSLNGRKMRNDVALNGLYIVKQGSNAKKVLLRN